MVMVLLGTGSSPEKNILAVVVAFVSALVFFDFMYGDNVVSFLCESSSWSRL